MAGGIALVGCVALTAIYLVGMAVLFVDMVREGLSEAVPRWLGRRKA
jgi:hypothetical protein